MVDMIKLTHQKGVVIRFHQHPPLITVVKSLSYKFYLGTRLLTPVMLVLKSFILQKIAKYKNISESYKIWRTLWNCGL